MGKSPSVSAIVEEPPLPPRLRTATNPVGASRAPAAAAASPPERPRDMMAEYEKKIIDAQASWAMNRSGSNNPTDPALAAKVGEMIKAQIHWDDTHHRHPK